MKHLLNIIVLSLVLLPVVLLAEDGKKKKTETVEIQTSAICGDCKVRLEKNLAFEKGVRAVELDEETKIISITYKIGKNDKESLKKAITKIGYDADEMPADQEAHDKLPACCQKGNEPH
ncbi:MAG: heavy-metal-associated domain-containing protein [Bacteroidales bacterium]|nr:heavy-metal-associated domain-containing protein [Bacteroidales bacterium]